jgi:acyl-CoA thioesterase FadM
VHGGYVAGLFDDVLGGTQALIEGPTGLTGTLTVRYRSLTPLDTDLVFLGWVDHARGRRILSKATCHAGDVLTAEAEALFVRVDLDAMARLAARRED